MKWKIKYATAMCVWLGTGMLFFSALVAVLLGRDFKSFYFTESYMFYQILMVLSGAFIIAFFFAGKDSGSKS